jgi:hypothetical protein
MKGNSKRKLASDNKELNNLSPIEDKIEEVLVEPENWTIVTALDRVLDEARESKLSEELWSRMESPLKFLRNNLGLTNFQIVAIAIMIEAAEPVSWRGFGEFVGCSRLSIMTYTEEMEDLLAKRWIVKKGAKDRGRMYEGFALVGGVVTALRHNKVFVPEKIDGLEIQAFVDKIEEYVDNNPYSDFEEDEEWFVRLCEANRQLPLCQAVLHYKDVHVRSLLLMTVLNFAQFADSDNEGLTIEEVDNLYPRDYDANYIRRRLRDGSHVLIREGYLEHACEDGVANPERYSLTKRAKEELLNSYTPSRSRCLKSRKNDGNLKRHEAIKEKRMFYNEREHKQIKQLCDLLQQDNLVGVQQRLEEQGMRKGFACLFYGEPGTGKTETVLQIARQTGRDIMQIDIAGMRDKYVGESEKNIKAAFSCYRDICRESETMPILFFNEADAIFGKRTTVGTKNSGVEKMENAMQNIILQEMETLEGILIATTNLTVNLDAAFDRRFLFKIEFSKPDTEVKTRLWKSMIQDLNTEEAHVLAMRYDFSGGQIDNIARKRTIDYILSGTQAGLSKIEEFCKAELLERKNMSMNTIGFRI